MNNDQNNKTDFGFKLNIRGREIFSFSGNFQINAGMVALIVVVGTKILELMS